jgi:hypothetical protein
MVLACTNQCLIGLRATPKGQSNFSREVSARSAIGHWLVQGFGQGPTLMCHINLEYFYLHFDLMHDAHPSELAGAASSSTRDGRIPVKAAQNCALRSKMMTISCFMPLQTTSFGSKRFSRMDNGEADFEEIVMPDSLSNTITCVTKSPSY